MTVMKLHYFFKFAIYFFAVFLLIRYIAHKKQSLPKQFLQIKREPVNLSSIYQPDNLDDNSRICPRQGEDLELFIAVMSAPHRVKYREAVRDTWGHFTMRRDIGIAFFMEEMGNSNWIYELDKEKEIYEDIVSPVLDELEFSTLKVMRILEWTNKYCQKAKFLLKTTDDNFINVSKLLLILSKLNYKENNIYGRLARMWTPNRNLLDPNSVSSDEYGDTFFPDFTIGPTYLIPTHLCENLLSRSLHHNFLRSDDVFFTGIVAESLGIRRIHVESFINARLSVNTCNVRRGLSLKCLKPIEMFDFWVDVHDLDAKCKRSKDGFDVQKWSFNYIDPSSSPNDLEKIYVMTF